jgi:hypothetical protein
MSRSRAWCFSGIALSALLFAAPLFAEPDWFLTGTGRDGAAVIPAATTAVVNSYAPVTGSLAAGSAMVTIGATRGAAPFDVNQLVMIVQTKAADPARVGAFELARIGSVSAGQFALTATLATSFLEGAQVIRVPEYTDVTIAGTIAPLPFDGTSGGVVALLAQHSVMFDGGAIDASAAGFRGGDPVDDPSGLGVCTAVDELAPRGAQKGEGFAATFGATITGRGNNGAGAGGGICFRSGGGGGGNGGAGGIGGNSDISDGSRAVGGAGGAAVAATLYDHLLLGGGGGAGHEAGGSGGRGGNGGGAVFLRTDFFNGNGHIEANGAPGANGGTDAAGGGGAGGMLMIRFDSTTTCNRIALSAHGGDGGSTLGTTAGPGGGGGGGQMFHQARSGACAEANLAGGAAGVSGQTVDPRGASRGADGILSSVDIALGQLAGSSIATPLPGQSTNNRRLPFTGSCPSSTDVFLYLDGVRFGQTTCVSTGWSFVPSSDLPVGTHNMRVTSARAGIESVPSNPAVVFDVDITPPAKPLISNPSAGTTVPSHYIVAGLAETGSRNEVRGGVTPVTSTAVLGIFRADVTFTGTQATLTVVSTDPAGNSATSDPVVVNVDAIPPVVTATFVSGNILGVVFSGTAEAGAKVTITVGAASETFSAGAFWNYTMHSLPSGHYIAQIFATDEHGNVGAPVLVPFDLDATPPALALTYPSAQTFFSGNQLIGTAEPGATVAVALDGSGNFVVIPNNGGTWNYIFPANLPEGSHNVALQARDAAGNLTSWSRSLTVDRIPPAAPTIVSPGTNTTRYSRTVLFGGSSEGSSSITILYTPAANPIYPQTGSTSIAGSWGLSVTFPENGTFTVSASATDSAGNHGPQSNVVVITTDDRVDLVLTPSVTKAVYGQPITYTAVGTFVATGVRIWEGSVSFSSIGSAPVIDDRATITVLAGDALPDITATYTHGTPVCCTNQAHVDFTQALTTVALGRSGNTFVATVRAVAPSLAVPDGFVTFRIGSATYVAPLQNGVATLSPPLPGGAAYNFSAAYGGTGRFYPSSVASIAAPLPAPAPAPPPRRRAAGSAQLVAQRGVVSGDSTPPAFFIDGVTNFNTVHPTFSGRCEAGCAVRLTIGSIVENFAAGATWTHTLEAALPGQGSYEASFLATAADGTSSGFPTSYPFYIDMTPPVVTFTSPESGGRANTLQGRVDDGSTIFLWFDTGETLQVPSPTFAGLWHCTLPQTLAEGPRSVRAWAQDRAGNVGTPGAPFSFVFDRTPPAPPVITSPSNPLITSHTITLGGTAEPFATITLRIEGLDSGTSTADANGSWSVSGNVYSNRAYALMVLAKDVANNQSAGSPFTANVDDRVAMQVTASTLAPIFGQPVTFTITGRFTANGVAIAGGTVNLAGPWFDMVAVPVVGGVATATIPISSTEIRLHNVWARYSLGTPEVDAPDLQLNVTPAPTTIALRRSGSSFIATVAAQAPSIAVPTGIVYFVLDGQSFIERLIDGVATAHPATLSGGTVHNYLAAYDAPPYFYPTSVASVSAPLPSPAPAPPARRRAAGS